MGELIFNGLLLVFFTATTFYSGKIEIWQNYYGARYWPMFFLIITDIIFAVKVFTIYKALPADKKGFKLEPSFLKEKGVQRLLTSFLVIIIYVLIVEYLGFFISTILLGMSLSFLLGCKHIVKLLISNLTMTIAIYAIFVWGLDVMVPRGTSFLYYFGYWLEGLI